MSYVTRNSFSNSASNPSQRAQESDYLDRMWKQYGLDESYRQDFYNNPYYFKWLKLRNKTGILSGLSEGLFGSSSASRNADQAYSDMLSYWSNLVTEKRVNAYNSEEEKANRMMSVGLNPNLLGTGDVANDYGNPEPAFGSPLESPSADLSAISSAASVVGSCVQGVLNFGSSILSLVQGFQTLNGLRLSNEGTRLDNELKDVQKFGSIRDIANTLAIYSITEDDYKPKEEGLDIDFPSTLADQYADKYFPESKDLRSIQMRDIFKTAFTDARSSIINKNKTYDDYLKYRKGLADPAQRNYNLYSQFQDALIEADYWDKKVTAVVSKFRANLYSDDFLQSLLKKKEFASLYESIAKSEFETKQAGVGEQVLDIQSEVYTEDRTTIKDSLKEEFRAAVQNYIAQQAQAALDQTTLEIRKKYFNDYEDNGTRAEFKYRPLSPARRAYDEAKGGSNVDSRVGNVVGTGAKLFVELLTM